MSSNLELMQQRLKFFGGLTEQERMRQGKTDGFKSALKFGSHSQTIVCKDKEYKVLINDNKLTQDYDEKIISAPKESGLTTGDIVYWKETNSYWIVYLNDISELSYTNAYMRKCYHEPIIKTNNGSAHVWAAVFGKEEHLIQSIIKTQVVIDTSKLTVQLLIPKTEENFENFKRYNKFILNGIAWEIQAVNSIDLENILIIYAQEDTNLIEDKPIENTDTTFGSINGKLVIKPLEETTYSVSDETPLSDWKVSNKNISIVNIDDREITIRWTSAKSGEFTISYGDYVQKIIVESLF